MNEDMVKEYIEQMYVNLYILLGIEPSIKQEDSSEFNSLIDLLDYSNNKIIKSIKDNL